jgi:broad specificity phosphatase PhoE
MIVHFLRHGRRDGFGDVPLNEEGRKQAQNLSEDNSLGQVSRIISSPKNRALMTVQPLAQLTQLEVEISKALDQMAPRETDSHFQKRIEDFLNQLKQGDAHAKIVICSHSDWLSMAVNLISYEQMQNFPSLFDCGQYKSFKYKDKKWQQI